MLLKPLKAKQFQPGVYHSLFDIKEAIKGLEISEYAIVSEVVSFSNEERSFVFWAQ